ncbi:sensor histidine kinase [Cohnella sp. CBP 2801]|uniref:Oxygen sensor histidine kinase NreB n=2 Tax=Cohnella zeiphila TaxID=2761120 RepID=A0A7X0SS46_9BACL|nr:sensor histidine kinase [Cohnella zeiphila]
MAMQSGLEPYVLFEERHRIAEELHDRIGPHLFGIACAVHSAQQDVDCMTDEQLREQLRAIQESAIAASRELRAAIYGLSLSEKGGLSWIGSVESLLATQARLNGVRIRFRAPDSDRRLSVHHQKALYRIISEAVGNAIRHGACTIVEVKLTMRRSAVTLRISDNGTGFDERTGQPRPKNSGFGLGNMKALASSLGGNLQIDSSIGEGTRIVVRLPLDEAHDGTGPN